MSTEDKLAPAAWRRPSIIDRAQWSYSTHEPAAWSEREALYDEATVRRLSAEVQELREALRYARPLLVKYAYTQGNRADFVREITAPIDAALKPEAGE